MNFLMSFVGGNALPIYETALYLNKIDEKGLQSVILLYSEKTRHANKIGDEFKKVKIYHEPYDVKTNDPVQNIEKKLSNIIKHIKSNYTGEKNKIYFLLSGGSKRMSVYGYLKLLNFQVDNEIIFLDLDGRNHKLWMYPKNNNEAIDLDKYTDCIKDMSFETLFKLYNMQLIKEEKYNLDSMFYEADFDKLFERLIRECEKVKEINKKWKKIELVTKEQIDKIYSKVEELPQYIKSEATSICKIADFFKDKWLEYYVQLILSSIMPNGEKVYRSIESTTGPDSMKTEFDVGTIYSGRLYYISCTTSMRTDDNKSKIYEALFRAKQLGGDLSCVIHVGCLMHDKMEDVKREIQEFDAQQNLHIISMEDLKKGTENLKETFRDILGIKEG